MDKSTPLISILIANYNNGVYLEACLKSIFQQTYTNWELIIVDDCSTDSLSFEIYSKLAQDNRITVHSNDANKGCGYTKAKAAALAKGDIMAFVDPDDALLPEALDTMVKAHQDHPNHSLIYSTHYICDAELNVLRISPHVGAIPAGESQLTFKGPKISHLASFKKYFYDKTECINSTIKTSVDQDLYFKMEEQGPVHFINRPLYYYRHHERSISLNENKTKANFSNVLVSKEAYIRRKRMPTPPKNLKWSEMSRRLYRFYVWQCSTDLNNANYDKFYQHWLRLLPYFYKDTGLLIPRLLLRSFKQQFTK